MKIAFIEATWNNTKNRDYSGVGYYRMVLPAKFIKEHDIRIIGSEIKTITENKDDALKYIFENHDIVMTKAIDNPSACSQIAYWSKELGKKLVVDLDDNYFEVRPDQPGYKWYYPGSQKRAILSAYLSFADHLIVSTQTLADYYKKFLKEVYNLDTPITVIPNYNDLKEFNYRYKGNNDRNIIKIGWQGSTTHLADLKMVMPVLKKLMSKYPNLHLDFMGGVEVTQVRELFGSFKDEDFKRVTLIGGTPSWVGYPFKLSKTRWDIGICPLIDDEFNRNKSHIKWMEYATYKIPSVASNVYPYKEPINGVKVIEHGKTGFLAKTEKDWEKYLTKLIEDTELRRKIGENAYEKIKKDWQMKDNYKQYEELFNKIYGI